MGPTKGTITDVEDVLSEKHGVKVTVRNTFPIAGGSINDAYRLETTIGDLFLKVNTSDHFPSMFEAEADGLERLANTEAFRIPKVMGLSAEDPSWILLEHIPSGPKSGRAWREFGTALAKLHRNTNKRFGLDRNNYIGSLAQVNTLADDWNTFMIHHRLEPLVKMARDSKKIEAGLAFRFERLYSKLADLFPDEAPALLHGDLWHGNFLFDEKSAPVLIDPAVYYGHREMDIGMSKLFDGFDNEFYSAYNSEWPLEKGWEERVDLCKLYPLLVHVNLFGGHYVQQTEQALRYWI